MPVGPVFPDSYQLFESIGVALLVLEPQSLILLRANKQCRDLFKLESWHCGSISLRQLTTEDSPIPADTLSMTLNACLDNDCMQQTFQFINVEKRIFWGKVVLQSLPVDTGNGILMTILDVNDIESLRKKERNTEADFHLLFDQMKEGVALHELIYDESGAAIDYRIVNVNAQFTTQTGITMDKALGAVATELYDSKPPPFLAEYARVAETGQPYQFQIYFPPMDRHFIISVASMRPGSFATIFFDITNLKIAEQKLAESQSLLTSITNAVPDFVYVLNLQESQFVFFNRDMSKYLGVNQSAVSNEQRFQQILELFDPEELAELRVSHLQAIRELADGQIYNFEHRMKNANQELIWVNQRVTVFQRDGQGHVTQILGVAEDVTERKQLENELDTIFSNSFDLISVGNDQGYLTKVNPAWTKLLGWTEQELLSKPYLDFVHPDDIELTLTQPLHTRSVPGISEFENRYRSKDGNWHWLSWSYFVKDGLYYAIARDISDRKSVIQNLQVLNKKLEKGLQDRNRDLEYTRKINQQVQDQLLASEKLAQLGELVAGITHEVNTPLGLAVTAGSFLSERAAKLSGALEAAIANPSQGFPRKFLQDEIGAIREASELILSNLDRANEIIASFKDQSTDQLSQRRRCFDLESIINKTIFCLQPRLRHSPISVRSSCEANLEMNSVPGDISQVLINLIINSLVHGLEGYDSGTITIQARRLSNDAKSMVLLEHLDDGRGIPPESLDRIFEPFYTTKPDQGGSGLGLHIVKSLVTQRLGGSIQVESQLATDVCRGFSRFSIEIPVMSPEL